MASGAEKRMRGAAIAAGVFAAALAIAAPAAAGMRATYGTAQGPKQLVIEVADNGDFRVGPPDGADYGVQRGGEFYLVRTSGGKAEVARLSDLAAAFDQMLPSGLKALFGAAASSAGSGKLTIEERGTRMIAGFEGTVYSVRGLGGAAGPVEMVISRDPALAPVGAALGRFVESTMVVMTPLIGGAAAAMVGEMRQVFALGAPLDGVRFRLERAEPATIAAERLALPATPLTAEQVAAEVKRSSSPR